MASVTLEHLSKIYSNGFVSVNDVSLRVDNGEFITLHGPSGCGKSTILRMIGGLEDITSGKIYLSDELLNDILPRDRRLAMAFQNYTLYKHFNAYDNMALGLRPAQPEPRRCCPGLPVCRSPGRQAFRCPAGKAPAAHGRPCRSGGRPPGG